MIEEVHEVNGTSCHILLSESYTILLQKPVVTFMKERHWLVAQTVKKNFPAFYEATRTIIVLSGLYQPKSNIAYTDE